jgi:hypothetical protein
MIWAPHGKGGKNMTTDTFVKDGFLYGPWRKSVNAAASMKESIHDDSVGRSVGMRGGVVAGTVHLDLFPPLAVKAFGQRWFEQGSLSMFYIYATLAGEEIRAVIKMPPVGAVDIQVEARIETPDGKTVMEGTMAVGTPKVPTHLRAMQFKNSPQEGLRILKGIKPGDVLKPREAITIASDEEISSWNSRLEEWLDWYRGSSPWGPAIIPLSRLSWLMQAYPEKTLQAVPFYGATEIRFHNGPAKVQTPYTVKGRTVCVGVGGRTEYYWIETKLHDNGGKLIASMLHLHRLMKAGSPLYPEIKQAES